MSDTTETLDNLRMHAEDSVLLLVRRKKDCGDPSVYDQLETLTKAACAAAGISFDHIVERATLVAVSADPVSTEEPGLYGWIDRMGDALECPHTRGQYCRTCDERYRAQRRETS